ncbi:MAG: DUF3179 domain-containing (seleno)protein [Isosphaeraceae bacterium]
MADLPEDDRTRRANGGGLLTRMGSWGALLALAGFLGYEIPPLYREIAALREDEARAVETTIMAWVDVHPVSSGAIHPDPFIVSDADGLKLWCGWSPAENRHRWFRVPDGQIDPNRLRLMFDRDTIRPIDRTVLETRGEKHWRMMPEAAAVIGIDAGEDRRAYPVQLLSKVEIVNDTIDSRPLVLIYTPFAEESRSFRIYDPILEGKRISMAASGYFHDRQPLLFDRCTESFWLARDDRLEAIAGEHRGRSLALIGRPKPTPWGRWSAAYPAGHLVVGADRKDGVAGRAPEELARNR